VKGKLRKTIDSYVAVDSRRELEILILIFMTAALPTAFYLMECLNNGQNYLAAKAISINFKN